jgi:hypothetical protein
MKTSSLNPVIGNIVKVPIQAKMDDDDEDLNCFHFGSSQESELDPPIVLESVWDCPGITLATTVEMMVRPSWAGTAVIALFPAIVVVLDSSSTIMH